MNANKVHLSSFITILQVFKPGECPQLTAYQVDCAEQCRTDADCMSDHKCCYNGCGTFCLRPQLTTSTTIIPTTTASLEKGKLYNTINTI